MDISARRAAELSTAEAYKCFAPPVFIAWVSNNDNSFFSFDEGLIL